MECTPKQRMLNAYRGIHSDTWAVAPEFWYYYPAKVLGLDMIRFQREVPHWQALQATFRKYGTDGWGVVGAGRSGGPETQHTSAWEEVSEGRFRSTHEMGFRGKSFRTVVLYDRAEPSWIAEYPVKRDEDVADYLDVALPREEVSYDFRGAVEAHRAVGEDYLLEFGVGVPFFDFIGGFTGFERAIYLFLSADPGWLREARERYTEQQVRLVREACASTPFEAFFIGCSASNNSLLGPKLWREWDKPFIRAVAEEAHRHGRLLHVHFHGRCIETVEDFSEIGIDCVCPFERPPGGDVEGLEGLRRVREALAGRVAMNGNVHTVETLIRGDAAKVRAEVREIKEVFTGEPRVIIGTGDQVGFETPEENIVAMIEEARA